MVKPTKFLARVLASPEFMKFPPDFLCSDSKDGIKRLGRSYRLHTRQS